MITTSLQQILQILCTVHVYIHNVAVKIFKTIRIIVAKLLGIPYSGKFLREKIFANA